MGNDQVRSTSLLDIRSRRKNEPLTHSTLKNYSEEKDSKIKSELRSDLRSSLQKSSKRSQIYNKNKYTSQKVTKNSLKNSIYFSLNKLQNKAEKNSPKQKMKINKDKGTYLQKPKMQANNAAQKQACRQKIGASTSSSDGPSRQLFLSPCQINKKKIKSIKETSLKKNYGIYGRQRNSPIVNQSPYNDNKDMALGCINVGQYNQKQQTNQLKQPKSPIMKATTGHQFYFSKNSEKHIKHKQKQENQKNKINLCVPAQNNKNPLSRQRYALRAHKKQLSSTKQPQNLKKSFTSHPSSTSSLKYSSSVSKNIGLSRARPSTLQLQQHQTPLPQKEYSICSGSQKNLSKINIQEIQSFIRLESQGKEGNDCFVFEESVILRGFDEKDCQNGKQLCQQQQQQQNCFSRVSTLQNAVRV